MQKQRWGKGSSTSDAPVLVEMAEVDANGLQFNIILNLLLIYHIDVLSLLNCYTIGVSSADIYIWIDDTDTYINHVFILSMPGN